MGNTISLHCAANGLGSLVFTWERRQPDQSWVVTSSDSLTTYNTTTDGFYRCRVENEAGAVVSNETQVHVYGNIILQGGVINLQTEWLVCRSSNYCCSAGGWGHRNGIPCYPYVSGKW